MKSRAFGFAAAILCCASLASAQQPLKLQITDGRVTLHAQNVPVRTILSEWSRLGGAKILNGERITSPPLTVELDNVPERQALDIILRGVSGYVLAARGTAGGGASMYDRIMILPTSAAPRNTAPAPAAPMVGQPGANGFRGPLPRVTNPDTEGDDDADAQANDGVPLARPVSIPRPFGAPVGPPLMPPAPIAPDEPTTQPPSGVVATPTNPFGLPAGSSTRPGVVTPAPPQQPQAQPPRNGQD
jgi:hypothetical protein